MEERKYCVYMLTNVSNCVIYTGVTGNLTQRIEQHKSKTADGFTKEYNVTKLVYYEVYSDIKTAIAREKQIKSWNRKRKEDLITLHNPEWEELGI